MKQLASFDFIYFCALQMFILYYFFCIYNRTFYLAREIPVETSHCMMLNVYLTRLKLRNRAYETAH